MVNVKSVKNRFLVSVAANIIRAGFSFIASLIIARTLGPADYGDLRFLLTSFTAFCMLLDFGMTSAFFTFISRRSQSYHVYLIYYGWLAIQFIILLLSIIFFLPKTVTEWLWLKQPLHLVLLAFIAAYLQQQVWIALSKQGEARRETFKVQFLNLLLAISYILFAIMLFLAEAATVKIILQFLIIQYLLAVFIAGYKFRSKKEQKHEAKAVTFKQAILDYWSYCKPLIFLSGVTFAYNFLDSWMLQYFSGAKQQGYYQVAYQIISISLLATVSILNVFWKEISEANAKLDYARMLSLYQKVSKGLVICAAVLSGFLIPWSEQIILITLGQSYLSAWPILAIIFLYPIHQALGQINGVMLLASANTRVFSMISIATMLASIPVTYFMLAPSSAKLLPGLELGGLGIALKMVVLNIISVNVQGWFIAKQHNWKFDWIYQVVGILPIIFTGYAVKEIIGFFWRLDSSISLLGIIPAIFTSFVIYGLLVSVFIIKWPMLAGFSKSDAAILFERCKLKFKCNK